MFHPIWNRTIWVCTIRDIYSLLMTDPIFFQKSLYLYYLYDRIFWEQKYYHPIAKSHNLNPSYSRTHCTRTPWFFFLNSIILKSTQEGGLPRFLFTPNPSQIIAPFCFIMSHCTKAYKNELKKKTLLFQPSWTFVAVSHFHFCAIWVIMWL